MNEETLNRTDAELETLMSRVRERVERQHRGEAAADPPSASLDGVVRTQAQFNASMVRSLAVICNQLVDLRNRLGESDRGEASSPVEPLEQALNAERERLDATRRELANEVNLVAKIAHDARQKADTALSHLQIVEEKAAWRQDEIRMRTLRAERAVEALRRSVGASEVSAVSHAAPRAEAGEGLGEPSEPAPPFDYFMFEHQFRGTGDDIRRRQSKYVELFAGRQHVLDLGCGRGEFLQLALQHGIGVTGVDSSEEMVAFCHDLALPAVSGDLFDYIRQQPDGSVDGIFCSQVIEHVQPNDLMRLVQIAARKLRSGAPIVMETINPHCPLALGNFFLDPTHQRPVPPALLRFMLEQELFRMVRIRFSAPVPGYAGSESVDVSDVLPPEISSYQDYAALAIRA